VLVVLAVLVAACAGNSDRVNVKPQRCTHVSGGYRACTLFGSTREVSAVYHQYGERWLKLPVTAPATHGWWRRVLASPDGRTLLLQWSGECELQSSYLVWSEGGNSRPIFAGTESEIVGWADDGPARVRLLSPTRTADGRIRGPGVYRVDPMLPRVYLERPGSPRRGC
jgi:hypothetical protein